MGLHYIIVPVRPKDNDVAQVLYDCVIAFLISFQVSLSSIHTCMSVHLFHLSVTHIGPLMGVISEEETDKNKKLKQKKKKKKVYKSYHLKEFRCLQ